MMYLGDFPVDYATLTFFWNTNDGDGASITRATDGTVKLIRDDGTDCTAGSITDTEDSPDTGIHKCVVDLSAHADCIAAHDYTVWLDGAVIDGETVNAALACFSVENRFNEAVATVNHADHGLAKLVRSTTPANKLDVSATGEAGIDLDNIKNPSGAKTLTNITVPVVTDVTNAVVTDAASRTASKANVSNLDVAVSSRSSHSVAEIITAIFAKTGITVGGAVTFAEIIKAIYAKARGQADKSGDDVSYKDDDDNTEVFKHSYTTTKRSVT